MWARSGISGGDALRHAQAGARERAFDPMGSDALPAGPYRACFIPARQAESLVSAWRKVEAHALVRDPFLHPLLLACVAKHDTALRDLQLLTLWRGETLCGLFPLVAKSRFWRRSWRIPRPAAAASGAPFLLRNEAGPVFAAACTVLRRRGVRLHLDLSRNETAFRALLQPPTTNPVRTPPAPVHATGPEQDRDLDAGSAAQFRCSGDPAFVRAGVEHLLDCDARHATATGTTPLLRDVGRVNTLRAATRAMAGEKRCRVAVLSEGGSVRAAAIILMTHDRAAIWHSTTDPAHPGAARQLHQRIEAALGRLRETPELITEDEGDAPRHRLRLTLATQLAGLAGRGADMMLPAQEPAGGARAIARRVRASEERSIARTTASSRGPSARRAS